MPLSFVAMPRGAFTGFQMIFLFSLSFLPEAERSAECVSLLHKWSRRSHTAGQTGKNECSRPVKQVPSDRKHSYFLCCGLPFSRFRWCLFLFVDFLFYGFSLKFFLPNLPLFFVYLHFAPFSEPHQSVIFVLGAKVIPGLDGKARSSLLFSAEISSPAGSISAKNLAFPNPYLFKHPKRKRPMRQKDA